MMEIHMTREIQIALEKTNSAIHCLLTSLDLNTDFPYSVLENIKTIQTELKIIEIKTTPIDINS